MKAELVMSVRARSTGGEMKEIGEIALIPEGYRWRPNGAGIWHGPQTLALIVETLRALNEPR